MDIFQAIAEPTRRSIVEMLAKDGRLSASEIGSAFDMSAPAISQHLKALREAGLVRVERQGKQRMYELDISTIYKIERWAHGMSSQWNNRLDKLGALLASRKGK